MSLFKGLIKRPVCVLMFVIMALVFGGISTINMEQALLPEISMPNIIVMTSYSGAGPEEVEKLVTIPIENAVSAVADFVNVTSTSSYGSSLVMIEVASDADMDFTSLKVREQISMIQALLPSEVSDPMIMELDTNNMPVMAIAMTSPMGFTEFSNLVENSLEERISSVPGTAKVTTGGTYENQIKIDVKKERLENYAITFTQLSSLLQMESATLPAGQLVEGHNTYTIKTDAEIKSLEEIQNLVIQTARGNVCLTEIADVYIAPKEMSSNVTVSGRNAVSFMIYKQPDVGTTDICDDLLAELDRISKDYNGIEYTVILNQADNIRNSINSVLESGIWGAIFAILVLLFFLRNIRSAIIIGCAIPISVIVSFIFMYFNHMTFNMMSLSGLVLGVGMLVDNSVVVLESIYSYLERGYDRTEAAAKGTKSVAMAVVASTLTSIAVYLPLFFMSDNIAITMFKEVALTIMFSLGASLIVALTLIPVLSSKILNYQAPKKKEQNTALMQKYKQLLAYCFHRKQRVVVYGTGAFIISIVALFFIGMEMFPATDSGSVDISIQLPKGTELKETRATGQEIVEAALNAVKPLVNVTHYMESYGSGGMSISASNDTSSGSINILLEDRNKRNYSSQEIAEVVRKALKDFAGVEISVSASDMTSSMMGSGSSLGITISGDEFDELKRLAEECESKLSALEGVRDVSTSLENNAQEYSIDIDRRKAAQYHVPARTIAQTIQTAFLGSTAGSVRIDGNEYDVVVRYQEHSRNTKADLGNILIPTNSGFNIPLSELAEIKKTDSPMSISRNAKKRIVTLSATPYGKSVGEINDEIEKLIKTIPLENGYTIENGDSAKDMSESMNLLLLMLLVSVLLVYMVMAAQFESLLHPFAVLFSIPLSMIGIVIALSICRMPLSVPAMIGIIALSGVVVNNAIILIDHANQLREEGYCVEDALTNSCISRIRPILITTITTLLGLFPMALSRGEGSEMTKPLAVAFIGGLSFSTLLTLFFVPCIYMILENLKQKLKRKCQPKESITL